MPSPAQTKDAESEKAEITSAFFVCAILRASIPYHPGKNTLIFITFPINLPAHQIDWRRKCGFAFTRYSLS
jgi:hypothetical protein